MKIKDYQEKPNEGHKSAVIKASVRIADQIQDYLEKDLPNHEENQSLNTMTEEEKKAQAEKEAQEIAAKKAEEDSAKKAEEEAAAKKGGAEPSVIKGESAKAEKVYSELTTLLKENKISLTLDELKKHAPTSYGILFDAYKEGEENGIEIGDISIKETEKQVFTISK